MKTSRTFIALFFTAALVGIGSADARTVRRAAPVRKPAAAAPAKIELPLQPTVPPAQRTCAAKTPTGLGYTALRAGTDPKPGATDTVLINYIGYLAATGKVFDQNMRSPLPVDGVIPGFSEGLQMTGRNGIVRLCIPAALGYGARGSGPVPANADLVFQVELVDFRTAAEIEQMRQANGAEPAESGESAPAPETPQQ
jgi:FKBP-type peptidyl-prolyl cis-trans isomerase FkpA